MACTWNNGVCEAWRIRNDEIVKQRAAQEKKPEETVLID
jgi:hypothetical protein